MYVNQVSLKRLTELENQILSGVNSVGSALAEIRDKKLHGEIDFEAYCQARFGWKRAYVYRLIQCSETAKNVSTIVDEPLPITNLVEIGKIPPKKQAKITAEVMERCELEDRKPTAKDFRAAAKPFVEKVESANPPQNPLEKPSTKVPKPKKVELPEGKVACIACDGKGHVDGTKRDQRFESWWQVILDNAPRSSRLRSNKVKAEKAWPKSLRKLGGTHKDPAGFLRAKVLEYINSDTGQSEFALNPQRLLNDEFWNEDPQTWINNDRDSIAKRNQTYDSNHKNFGVVKF